MEVDVYAASWSEVQWYYFLQLQLSTVLVGHSVIHKELKREHEKIVLKKEVLILFYWLGNQEQRG